MIISTKKGTPQVELDRIIENFENFCTSIALSAIPQIAAMQTIAKTILLTIPPTNIRHIGIYVPAIKMNIEQWSSF